MVDAHVQTEHLIDSIYVPAHPARVETDAFRASKRQLHEDGILSCWRCLDTNESLAAKHALVDRLQVHHMFAEACEERAFDGDYHKLRWLGTRVWDVYGYGEQLDFYEAEARAAIGTDRELEPGTMLQPGAIWDGQRAIVTTVDWIGNMTVLCQTCHTAASTGIHRISFPTWIAGVSTHHAGAHWSVDPGPDETPPPWVAADEDIKVGGTD